MPDFDTPIWSTFEAVALQQPDKCAVDDGSRALSYRELHDASLAVAQEISRSTAPGALVAAVVRHTASHPLAVLACLASGHPCLVLDAYHPAARNTQVIADARAGAMLLDRLTTDQVPMPPPSCARIELAGQITPRTAFAATPATPDTPAFVISTSGSTGTPKCIVLSQRNMLHQFAQDTQSCQLTASDRLLPLGSPAAVSPLRGLLTALLNGGTLYLRDLHDGFAPLFATMHERQITVSRIGPSLLRAMITLPRAADAFRTMRIIRVGGEILFGQDVARMRAVLPASCTLVFAYGSTELPPVIERLISAHDPVEEGPLHIGAPLAGSELSLVDEYGAVVPPGEPGELLVRGPHLALGYWVAGHCVPGAIVPDPRVAGYRSFRSGDVLRHRSDGCWEFVARVDHQVKIRGNRVEPGETEAVLRALPGVVDAVVVSTTQGDTTLLAAFIVPSGNGDELLQRLRPALAERLPDHARPSRIVLLDRVPRLNTFKPDVAALRRMLQ